MLNRRSKQEEWEKTRQLRNNLNENSKNDCVCLFRIGLDNNLFSSHLFKRSFIDYLIRDLF